MCYLTTVVGSFHGRVLAARLGAEGVLVVLKGTTDGPYPLPSAVDVLVPADQLSLAREILLADAVDDAFGDVALGEPAEDESGPTAPGGRTGESDLPPDRPPRGLHSLAITLVVLLVATTLAAAFVAAAAH